MGKIDGIRERYYDISPFRKSWDMIKLKNFIFVSFFFVVIIFIIQIIFYNMKQDALILISNNFYTNNYMVFYDNDLEKWSKAELGNQCRLFIEYDNNTRFCFKNNEWNPPFIKGKFFSRSMKGRKAVVGKEIEKQAEYLNGKKYISINNVKYEIIGILGGDFKSKSDSLILLYGGELPNRNSYKIVLDGESKNEVRITAKRIMKKYPKLVPIEPEIEGVARVTGTLFFQRLLNLNGMILVCFLIVIFFTFWERMHRKENYVLYLLGVNKKRIMLYYLKNILVNLTISILLGSCFILFVMKDIKILVQPALISILFIFLFLNVVVALTLLRGTMNKNFA